MGRDRIIGASGDYLSDGRGGRQTTQTAATKCYHQLKTARNTWCGDPDAGADYHLLERKVTDEELARAADMTRAALERLVTEGVIRDVQIETGSDQRGRAAIQWVAFDVATGEKIGGVEVAPYGA